MNTSTNRDNSVKQNSIPQELKALPQWVCWKPGTPRPDGKIPKIPTNPHTGKAAKVNDSKTWGTFDQAYQYFLTHENIQGVGFVFTDGYVGIDLDHCFLANGKVTPLAEKILSMVQTYTETSQSLTGLHLIVKGVKPEKRSKISKINTVGGEVEKKEIEVYETGRFFAITGNVFFNRHQINQVDLRPLYQEFFQPAVQAMGPVTPNANTITDDDALIRKASEAHDGQSFLALWQGDTSNFASASEADWALCRKLAFWTGNNSESIDRLFRQSGLMRSKWNENHNADGQTYGQITIMNAIKRTKTTYTPAPITRAPHPADNVSNTSEPSQHAPKFRENDIETNIDISTHTTDMGNARRLVKYFGHKIRFCVDHNAWYIWNKHQWQMDTRSNAKIVKLAKKTGLKIYAECADIEDKGEREEMRKWAKKSEEKKRITDMIFLAQTEDEIEIEAKQLDADPYLLNCKNGVIDLKTGELRPHAPTDFMTKYVPIEYDPKASCPKWEEAVMKYMGADQDDIKASELVFFLQRAVGYSLTADKSEQCLFFLYGDGKNGKSTFINTISKLLGDYFQHVRIESLLAKQTDTIPNDIATLPGARMVVSSEIPENRRMNETLVKDLTGGDAITARFLRQEFFTFYPVFKLWIFGNDKPIVSPSDAMFRRIKMIPFNVQIPEEERDPHFEQRLEEELPGILRWAVDGCQNWLQHGLNPPQAIIDATNAYRDEMDILTDFIEECCVVLPSAKVTVKDLFEEFQSWCSNAGKTPIAKQNFNKRLEKRLGNKLTKGAGNSNKTTWFGLGLLSEPQIGMNV